jgi:hypothetical protein
VQDAGGRHHEAPAPQRAERLESLAEAHVVGEEGSETRVPHEAEPVDAIFLVVAQRGVQVRGKLRAGDPFESLDQRSQSFEAGRAGRVELVAQASQVGQGTGSEVAIVAAGGQQVGDSISEALEPVPGQLGEAATLAEVEGHQAVAASPGLHDRLSRDAPACAGRGVPFGRGIAWREGARCSRHGKREAKLEVVVACLEARLEGGQSMEAPVCLADHLPIPAVEPLGQGDGLFAV